MTYSILHLISAFTLSILLLNVVYLVCFKSLNTREKNTPFECGFDPKSTARVPFSVRFFLLMVVFLIFDIEVTLLFPVVAGLMMNFFKPVLIGSMLFLLVLLAGLLHEWQQGSLSWVK